MLKMSNHCDVVVLENDNEVVVVQSTENKKKLRLPKTVWNRENTGALVHEMTLEDDNKGEISDLKYGQTISYWNETANAMKQFPHLFPGNSFPSGKTCRTRWEDFSKEIETQSKNSAWLSIFIVFILFF
jgi:hypothetical protein